jgi:hypothetical protein
MSTLGKINGLLLYAKEYYKLTHYLLNQHKYPAHPIYFFHHIPKCGGESIARVLDNWFFVVRDISNIKYKYLPSWFTFTKLNSNCCVHGHFHFDGFRLEQRYPVVFSDPLNYRIICFVRDPLQTVISKYYYSVRNKRIDPAEISLDRFLSNDFTKKEIVNKEGKEIRTEHVYENTNFLAKNLACNNENYKQKLDKYFFIGIIDYGQESIDKLAGILGKKTMILPHINRTSRNKDFHNLSEEVVECFKNRNELDYLIYSYCLEKYNSI